MTKLEKLDKEIKEFIKDRYCPGDFGNYPECDHITLIDKENYQGCRGISCEECWNLESEEK